MLFSFAGTLLKGFASAAAIAYWIDGIALMRSEYVFSVG